MSSNQNKKKGKKHTRGDNDEKTVNSSSSVSSSSVSSFNDSNTTSVEVRPSKQLKRLPGPTPEKKEEDIVLSPTQQEEADTEMRMFINSGAADLEMMYLDWKKYPQQLYSFGWKNEQLQQKKYPFGSALAIRDSGLFLSRQRLNRRLLDDIIRQSVELAGKCVFCSIRTPYYSTWLKTHEMTAHGTYSVNMSILERVDLIYKKPRLLSCRPCGKRCSSAVAEYNEEVDPPGSKARRKLNEGIRALWPLILENAEGSVFIPRVVRNLIFEYLFW